MEHMMADPKTNTTSHRSSYMEEHEVEKRLQPVIVGGDFLAYSYVREFHRAYGIKRCIVILTKDIKMITSSRFTDCRIIENAFEPERLYQTLLDIADELKVENPLRIPMVVGCDDRHAFILAEYKNRLEQAGYVVPYNGVDMLEQVSRKRNFYDLCGQLDIPYPKTCYYDCGSEGPEELPVEEFVYPLVAKPSDTPRFQNARITDKRKCYEIDSPQELSEVWHDIRTSDYDGTLILQDYIPGGDENLRSLTTFTDREGNIRAVSGGIVCLQDHSPSALGNPLCIIDEYDAQMIEYAQRLLKHVGFVGFGNFDLKYDERTGHRYFFEMNARPGRNTYYMSLGGINFVTLLVDAYVLGKEMPYTEAYEPFAYCCVPPYVLKRSIGNENVLRRALELRKRTKDPYPLYYASDTLVHNFWSIVMYYNQIRKFKKFFWDTDGKQLKG